MHNEYVMLEEVTTDLIEVLNKWFPKLDCGYYKQKDEDTVKELLANIHQMNKANMAIIYPPKEKT
tara:strand:- start:795 stop:989 length:195 start_codon:yes stop_codon:yes gene_type:complete